MLAVFHPDGIVKGTIDLPASKSIANRVLIIRKLSGYDFAVNGLPDSTDTIALKKLLGGNPYEMNCGDGGTTLRFLLAAIALRGEEHIITGNERLKQRPVKPLVDALNGLGAKIEYREQENFPPLKVLPSKLIKDTVSINSSVSSQFVSALMMIAPLLPKGLTIKLEGEPVSHSYILLTKSVMEYFGVAVNNRNDEIKISPSQYIKRDIEIEKDWSSASYWFLIAALAKEADLFLKKLSIKSLQGDRAIIDIAALAGVKTEVVEDGLRLRKTNDNIAEKLEYNFIDQPDLVPTVAILCAGANVAGKFSGLQTLTVKESDRVKAVMTSLQKFGVTGTYDQQNMMIPLIKELQLPSTPFDTFKDHRMAMSVAPLSLVTGKLYINNPEVVSKSYPDFWKDLEKVGFVFM